jgi:RHS repeat-associated protein
VEGTYTSLPYGDNSAASGTDTDANHYAMLDHDSESGTDHAQFRQYGNTQGRFMSPDPYDGSYDPSNPQSFNRYAYALNSPLSYVDPSGLCSTQEYDEGGNPITCIEAWTWRTYMNSIDLDGSMTCSMSQVDCQSYFIMLLLQTSNASLPVSSRPSGGGGGGGGSAAPNNVALTPQAQGCQAKIQGAVNNALNTNSTFLGPTAGPGMSPMGYRNGAYNFNYFAPGVVNPVAGSTNGSGRFPGSGLHIPLPGGQDPTISPWGYNAAAGGSYFTAHFDTANPFDDLVSFFEHIINDVILRRGHGC